MTAFAFGIKQVEKRSVISLTLDGALLDEAIEQCPQIAPDLATAEKLNTVLTDIHEDGSRTIGFDFNKAFKRREANRAKGLHAAARSLILLSNETFASKAESPVRALIGTQATSLGRLPMLVDLEWPVPEIADDVLSAIGTQHMRGVAESVRHNDEFKRLEDRVATTFAVVERESGITFETLPMISCGITTDATYYRPEKPRAEVTASNIYSPWQQIICLGGAIAVATASELLANDPQSVTITE